MVEIPNMMDFEESQIQVLETPASQSPASQVFGDNFNIWETNQVDHSAMETEATKPQEISHSVKLEDPPKIELDASENQTLQALQVPLIIDPEVQPVANDVSESHTPSAQEIHNSENIQSMDFKTSQSQTQGSSFSEWKLTPLEPTPMSALSSQSTPPTVSKIASEDDDDSDFSEVDASEWVSLKRPTTVWTPMKSEPPSTPPAKSHETFQQHHNSQQINRETGSHDHGNPLISEDNAGAPHRRPSFHNFDPDKQGELPSSDPHSRSKSPQDSGNISDEYSDHESAISAEEQIHKPKKRKSRKTKVSRAPRSKTAKEWHEKAQKNPKKPKKKSSVLSGAVRKGTGGTAKLNYKGLQNFMQHHDPITNHANNANQPLDDLIDSLPKDGKYQGVRSSRGDQSALDRAKRSFGFGNAKHHTDTDKWEIKGMRTHLLPHQLIGSSWMLAREFSYLSGGINADAMGLGKTLQLLAVHASNPRTAADFNQGTGGTLIIVPSSIAAQWMSESLKHLAAPKLNVMIYKRSQNLHRNLVATCDIVVATYEQLRMSIPFPKGQTLAMLSGKYDNERRKKGEDPKAEDSTSLEKWIKKSKIGAPEKDVGVLQKISWYRIVLDEAHFIKNHMSRTSLAADALDSRYRWAMSGTPIMNRREELYAYFRLLKDPETTTYAVFKRQFCNEKDKECDARLDNSLADKVIRRTMNDKVHGKPIIELPTPHHNDLKLEFSQGVEILYRAVESRFRDLTMKELEKGDPQYSMTYQIVRILRLRQFTASPILMERTMKSLFDIADLLAIKNELKDLSPAISNRLQLWINDKMEGNHAEEDPVITDDTQCYICRDLPEDPQQIISCGHIFCGGCIMTNAQRQEAEGLDKPLCPECNKAFDIERLKSLCPDSETNHNAKKGKDALNYVVKLPQRSRWLEDFEVEKAELPESPKIEAIKKQILRWNSDVAKKHKEEHKEGERPKKHRRDKIVIFVQWRLMMRLIGIMLEEQKLKFLYYTGDMNTESRDEALKLFEESPSVNIMIMGLKVGSLGLNIAFANRAILVDLWWNAAVESQAYSRIFRIGQDRESYYARTIINKTIDVRLFRMQKKKTAMINKTFGLPKLSREDRLSLLGNVIYDEDGNVEDIQGDYDNIDLNAMEDADANDGFELGNEDW